MSIRETRLVYSELNLVVGFDSLEPIDLFAIYEYTELGMIRDYDVRRTFFIDLKQKVHD